MAGAIVDFVVEKLKEPALQEILFQWRIKAEIGKITTRLENMKGYVEDLGWGKQETKIAQNWANRLREATLEVEDLVDELMLDMEVLELDTPPCKCQLKPLIATVQIFTKKVKIQFCFHQQLKDMDERLLLLENEKSKYNIQLKTNEGSKELVGSGSGYMEGIEAVGIDMEVERISQLIEKRSGQVKLITIWGAGGSGKTTLAKQVYERVKDDRTVDYCCWVDVNHSSDIEYVLRKTISGLHKSVGTKPPQEVEKADRNWLQQHILEYLAGKRYVVFFDDVWDHTLLPKIRIPYHGTSSIIVTSRDKNIADGSFLYAVPHYFEVKPLEFDLACSLFCKLAFCNNSTFSWPNDIIKGLGEALVEKCSGLPVAILAMARLMSTKGDDPAKWRDALKSLNSEFEGSLAAVNRALLLSYNELPTHLKSCFLYCAMIPKTYNIVVEEFIRWCIAEGFINEEEHGGRTLEDIGRDYFLQLQNRSLLQIVTDYSNDEETERNQMHDLYRDVACQVIRREMFAEIILEQNNSKLEWKQRRLIILDDEPKVKLDNYENMKKLRTLVLNCKGIAMNSFPQMLQNMKLLRVLALGYLPDDIEELPSEIGDLIHLRYISVEQSNISRLPDSFGRLHNLQTLDLSSSRVRSLPKCVSELKQLRHLFGCNKLDVADTVFTFPQLQTLSGIRISTIQARELLVNIKHLTELKIKFKGEECWRAICASLNQITNLRSLSITRSNKDDISWEFGNFSPPPSLEKLVLRGGFEKLAKFTCTPNYLRSINIEWCDVDEDFFNSLEKLPSLVFLNIDSYIGEKLVCSAESFQKLKRLQIECRKVTKWEIGKGAMKWLESLSMWRCECLEMFPQGLRQLEYLKHLYLHLPSQQLLHTISATGSDRWKVEHIPRVTIKNYGETPFLLS